jgi:hypothetical protein
MNRRSASLALVCGLFLACTGWAVAQDPNATSAQIQARKWLELTDRGDALASWQAAGKQFQNQMTAARWATLLKRLRAPLGASVERTVRSTQFTRNFSGATPDGDYALLEFRSSFANRTGSGETLTLEREADGTWRVIGYTIH